MNKRAKSITVEFDISALDDLDFYDQIKEIQIVYVHMDKGTNQERRVVVDYGFFRSLGNVFINF